MVKQIDDLYKAPEFQKQLEDLFGKSLEIETIKDEYSPGHSIVQKIKLDNVELGEYRFNGLNQGIDLTDRGQTHQYMGKLPGFFDDKELILIYSNQSLKGTTPRDMERHDGHKYINFP